MNDVFVSYSREDRARVERIVEGLEQAGLSVWWDRDVPAGARWRQTILERLEAARCVVVVWSARSVGPEGEFVHEEAGLAKARGVLLPVHIDRVAAPIGFGEIQSLDLVGWRGNTRQRRFRNVVATAKALVAGGPRPRPVTGARRARLVVAWSGAGAIAVATLGFAADVVGLQAQLCRAPGVHAVCASWGLGGVPTRRERDLWAARSPGDCAALRSYLAHFPRGAYAEEAQRRLLGAETETEETWTPAEHRLPLTVTARFKPHATEAAARADAVARAKVDARSLCAMYEAGEHRLTDAAAEVGEWRCFAHGDGVVCGFKGEAICQVEARHEMQRQVCP